MCIKGNKREFRWALIVGLVLWFGIMAASLLFGNNGPSSGQEQLFVAFKKLMDALIPIAPVTTMVVIYAWMCLIQPIIEEFAFRYWGKGKLYAYIVSSAVLANFAFFTLNIWSIVFSALCIVLFFVIRDQKRKMQVSIITTSVLFALMHVSGFSTFSWPTLFGLLQILGMALVMCYVVINYRFIYSAVIHVLNNSIALLLPLILMSADENISGNGFEGRLRMMELNEAKELIYEDYLEDTVNGTILFCGELPDIVDGIYYYSEYEVYPDDGEMRFFYPDNTSLWTRYVLECKTDNSCSANDLVEALLKTGRVKSDTSLVPALEVSIADKDLFYSKTDSSSDWYDLNDYVYNLSLNYKMPLVLAPGADSNALVGHFLDLDINKGISWKNMILSPLPGLDNETTAEKVIAAMRKDYGLSVTESKTRKIKQVRFYCQ